MTSELKLWVVTVDTEWCGTQETYLVIATEENIYSEADTLAYDNYMEKIGDSEEELQEEGYDSIEECISSSVEEYIPAEYSNTIWDEHNIIVLREWEKMQ